MIALDTNILVRYLVQDDPRQASAARKLVEEELTAEHPGYVTVAAVLELDWVLRTRYLFAPSVVVAAIDALMESSRLVFENAREVGTALKYKHGDLADNILHQVARSNGCTHTVTFDKKFARLENVELLT